MLIENNFFFFFFAQEMPNMLPGLKKFCPRYALHRILANCHTIVIPSTSLPVLLAAVLAERRARRSV